MNVALFCGGRGSATIIKEFIKRGVDLTLIVNGYDDGLSTGAIREHCPGILGPSDFRKNLSYICDEEIGAFLEYRIKDKNAGDLDALQMPNWIKEYVATASLYLLDGSGFDFTDMAVGNLLFLGVYLKNGRRFNSTLRELTCSFDAKAELVNVSDGTPRILTALCENGEVLLREADIVAEHASPIRRIFLSPFNIEDQEGIFGIKKLFITHSVPMISPNAARALKHADLIVYGPGTQHSSLFPSYLSAWPDIMSAKCPKVFIMNLDSDHDTKWFRREEIIKLALRYLNDDYNSTKIITHSLIHTNTPSVSRDIQMPYDVMTICNNYRSVSEPHRHNGETVVDDLMSLC